MVLNIVAPVLSQIVRTGIKALTRYYRLEGKAFNKLYTGFPQSKTIGRGVRHGLTVGSVAGSFINSADDSPGNGIQTPFKSKPPSRQPYKARYRFSVRNRRRYSSECRPRRYNRYPNARRFF